MAMAMRNAAAAVCIVLFAASPAQYSSSVSPVSTSSGEERTCTQTQDCGHDHVLLQHQTELQQAVNSSIVRAKPGDTKKACAMDMCVVTPARASRRLWDPQGCRALLWRYWGKHKKQFVQFQGSEPNHKLWDTMCANVKLVAGKKKNAGDPHCDAAVRHCIENQEKAEMIQNMDLDVFESAPQCDGGCYTQVPETCHCSEGYHIPVDARRMKETGPRNDRWFARDKCRFCDLNMDATCVIPYDGSASDIIGFSGRKLPASRVPQPDKSQCTSIFSNKNATIHIRDGAVYIEVVVERPRDGSSSFFVHRHFYKHGHDSVDTVDKVVGDGKSKTISSTQEVSVRKWFDFVFSFDDEPSLTSYRVQAGTQGSVAKGYHGYFDLRMYEKLAQLTLDPTVKSTNGDTGACFGGDRFVPEGECLLEKTLAHYEDKKASKRGPTDATTIALKAFAAAESK